ncbi:MAG: hypothetical protein HOL66_14765 [Rhodospirillaceae bacterium]|jgi:putative methyltransferase (TIGR04325 family)|nr:hypothetical protein [Rhodospirillaceae bacterium]MBT5245497.1 hypothetical protein [Rhodospirillaceae bacterium]MBT5560979.1 hypothetical protein [Rhodospirillaceae bacterium]MBT6240615.1 hypothetical protein [Rhodospirillaceae bacterium]MBT7137920.1 hypothetical protein [Rhodospirillaceae bacterium]
MFVTLDEKSDYDAQNVFRSDAWVDYSEQKLNEFLCQVLARKLQIPQAYSFLSVYSKQIFLPADQSKALKILDLGGGVGQVFPALRHLMNVTRGKMGIDYTVIDNDKACQRGREIFSGNRPIYLADSGAKTSISEILLEADNVQFITSPNDLEADIDVLICAITLPYIDNLSAIIALIEKNKPRFVFFTCFLAHDGDQSISLAQIFPDHRAYINVTAHSTTQIASSLVDLGYQSMTATGNYEIEDVEGFSETFKQLHPGVRMVDLCFSSSVLPQKFMA